MTRFAQKCAWWFVGSIAALLLVFQGSGLQKATKPIPLADQTWTQTRTLSKNLHRAAPADFTPRPNRRIVHRPSLESRLHDLLKCIQSESDTVVFEESLNAGIVGLAASEIPAALAFFQNAALEEKFAGDLQIRLIRHWAGKDPTAAVAWVSAQPPGLARELALKNVAIIYSQQDFSATAAWASQLADGPERDRILSAVANEALRLRPAEALQLAANLPATPANDDLIRRAAMEWTSKDPPQALRWARQIADEELRAHVLAGVAVALGDRDPVAAGRLVLAEMPAGRMQNDAIVGIVQRWAQQSPEAAARWVASFPEGSLRQAAAENVAAAWTQNHPQATAVWKADLNHRSF